MKDDHQGTIVVRAYGSASFPCSLDALETIKGLTFELSSTHTSYRLAWVTVHQEEYVGVGDLEPEGMCKGTDSHFVIKGALVPVTSRAA